MLIFPCFLISRALPVPCCCVTCVSPPPLSAGFISNSYIGTHSNQHAHSMSQHSQTIDMLALHMSETMIMAALVVAACGVLYTLLLLRMKSRQPGSKTPEQWNQDLLVSVL